MLSGGVRVSHCEKRLQVPDCLELQHVDRVSAGGAAKLIKRRVQHLTMLFLICYIYRPTVTSKLPAQTIHDGPREVGRG